MGFSGRYLWVLRGDDPPGKQPSHELTSAGVCISFEARGGLDGCEWLDDNKMSFAFLLNLCVIVISLFLTAKTVDSEQSQFTINTSL